QLSITRERCPFRSECLPALAAADGALDGCSGADRHVTKLTRSATFTAINLPVKNDTRTNAFFNQYEHEVAHLADFRTAKPQLSQRCCVGVIINGHGQRCCARQSFGKRRVPPVVVRHIQIATIRVYYTG